MSWLRRLFKKSLPSTSSLEAHWDTQEKSSRPPLDADFIAESKSSKGTAGPSSNVGMAELELDLSESPPILRRVGTVGSVPEGNFGKLLDSDEIGPGHPLYSLFMDMINSRSGAMLGQIGPDGNLTYTLLENDEDKDNEG